MSKIDETFADLEHERWSGWMKYLFTKGKFNEDGSFTIEPDSVIHWQKEVETKYQDLTEIQKESDRKEVKKYYEYYQTLLTSLEKEEQAHVMSVYDLNMKIAGLEITLEKEKERAVRAESEIRKWQAPHDNTDLQELKEQSQQISLAAKQAYINGLEWHLKKAEEKVSELDDRIEELVILIDGYAGRIIKSEERVKELSDEKLNRHDEVMMWVEKCNQTESCLKELEEAVKELPTDKLQETQRIMRENGFVIDNLDDRWQKLCFTFYTDICEMSMKIEELYKVLEEVNNVRHESRREGGSSEN